MQLFTVLAIALVVVAALNAITYGYGWYVIRSSADKKSGEEHLADHPFIVYSQAACQSLTALLAIGVLITGTKRSGYR